MSNIEDSIQSTDEEDFLSQFFPPDSENLTNNNSKTTVLKSKENLTHKSISETKQKKRLKNKYKKYKLRKNGNEDADIVTVSEHFSLSLKFQSPCKINNNNYEGNENIDEWTINYLTKMVKKTEKSVKSSNLTSLKQKFIDKVITEMDAINTPGEISENVSACEADNTKDKPVQMNAFMLMMGARNKSIGSNSPGKDNVVELGEDEKAKKSLKLKRNLALEKMAIAKGSNKNKLLEETRDEIIKKKMEKRAENLKAMVSSRKPTKNAGKKNKAELTEECKIKNSVKKRSQSTEPELEKPSKRTKTIAVDNADQDDDVIFIDKTVIEVNNAGGISENAESFCSRNNISKSDSEFLSKLSPSIKKKENMLSYFNKIEKENEDECFTGSIIKVKFTPRRKTVGNSKPSSNRKKKDKQSKFNYRQNEGNGDNTDENISVGIETSDFETCGSEKNNSSTECKSKNKEHKKNKHIEVKLPIQSNTVNVDLEESHSEEITPSNERRSKRITKKPIKYQHISDSEEELLVSEKTDVNNKISSKRLKLKMLKERNLKSSVDSDFKASKVNVNIKIKNKTEREPSKKLAPIFSPKTQMSKADFEAKQKFLHSGIPDTLKKIIEKQKLVEAEIESFNSVCHIQQKYSGTDDINIWSLNFVHFDLQNECNDEVLLFDKQDAMIKINYQNCPKTLDIYRSHVGYKDKLLEMKSIYPKFPVYKIYRDLKTKCIPTDQCNIDINNDDSTDVLDTLMETKVEDPKTIMWCDKFKPDCSSDIIGNFDGVISLKKWLIDWKEANFERSQRICSDSNSSDSDFYYGSDTDSRDSLKCFNNVLIVTGPPGCGKTCSVYAIANELSMKVIEVNTSSKRSGKVILSNLQEATQSHKVNRAAISSENSQNSQEVSLKKNKRKSKTYSKKINMERKKEKEKSFSQNSKTEINRKGMSLILVEDADVVFEQDDGFISGLNQIIQVSKRPVILVTSSLNCLHLQRFRSSSNVIKFNALSPKMLGMWLNVMCVVENGDVGPDVGQSLLEYCQGDIRKATNILHFWIGSSTRKDSETNSEESVPIIDNNEKLVDDETSIMSWCDQDTKTESQNEPKRLEDTAKNRNQALFKLFTDTHDHDIGIIQSVLQFPVNHLNIWWNIPQLFKLDQEETCKKQQMNLLSSLAKLADRISVSDVLSNKLRPSLDTSVLSIPWRSKVYDSVSENINTSPYNSGVSLGDSISYALLTSAIGSTQKRYRLSDDELQIDYTLPGFTQTRSKELLHSRQSGLYDCVPLCAQLDRRGLAVDYLSACRSICRIEKDKSGNNSKRNNRFCHYLRSMKVTCSAETLEILGDSLK